MEPLELRADTMFPLTALLLTGFFSLVLLITACIIGAWGLILILVLPLAAFLWLRERRGYRLLLYPGHLEVRTRRAVRVIPYAGVTAELRLRTVRSSRTVLNGHQPLLCLRREGTVLLTVPRGLLRSGDAARLAAFLRKAEIAKTYLY